MKHFLHNSLRALFLSLSVFLSSPMLALEVMIDGIKYDLNAETKHAAVIRKHIIDYYSGDVVIPESVVYQGTTYSVTSIGASAFWNSDGMTSVTIPNSITSIGDGAFHGCSGLTSVIIPNSVTSIGKNAFHSCSGLTSVTLPNSVTRIEYMTFKFCSKLTSVTIPNSVMYIGDDAFGGCSGLKSVTIPNNVRSIGNGAFENCTGLTSVTIPNGVTSILDRTFGGCSGLTSVSIPNSVRSIGYGAFADCSGLTSVTIGNSVTSIGESAFEDCSGLTSLTIPNSVTSIGQYAFSGCSGLTSVTIPNSVTSIESFAFRGCNLTSIHISDIAAWCNIEFSNTFANPLYYADHLYLNGEDVKDLVIPNSVTSIGDCAFSGCKGLSSVTMPNSVTSIGEYAFYNCSDLSSVIIPNSVKYIDNYVFSGCSGLTSVTIPNSVTSIREGAFSGCSGLTSVTIPNSVTSIGGYTFYQCSALTSVTIPNSVTSIEQSAFYGCTVLKDVYCYAEKVPSTNSYAFDESNYSNATLHVPAASIESYKTTEPWSSFGTIKTLASFSGEVEIDGINYELNGETKQATVIAKSSGSYSDEVVIPESVEHQGTTYSVTSIGEGAFYYCSGLTSVTIANSVESIGDYAFCGCKGLTSVTIPNSVESIGDCAFLNCSGLTSVTIPNSVTSIGERAFYGCSGLTSVTIPNSVKSIGEEAFYCCDGLTSVTIPNSVTSIGERAFGGCHGLSSIVVEDENPVYDSRNNCNAIIETATNTLHSGCKTTIIPNSVTSIGDDAFYWCSGLTSVTIGNSVTSIGNAAFCFCSGLTSVTIANSVESIGDWAFEGCSGLTSVTIGSSVESIGDKAFYGCSGLTSIVVEDGNSVYDSRNNCNAIIETAINTLHSGCKTTIIPNSVTSIVEYAFGYCSGLTSVAIPNSVTSIGKYAFIDCHELHDVYCYAENVPSAESDAFEGSPIGNATLHVPAASVDSYRATAPWSSCGKIVAISESTNDLVIKDGESFENTEERELGTLTYTRTLPNRYWNPLYVPFKIPYEALKDNYDVAYINSMHSYDNDQDGEIEKMTMEVIKIKKGVLKANHPYLIRAKNEAAKQMDLLLEDVTLYPTVSNKLDCSSVYTHFEITGTYKEMTRADLGGSLVITTDGAWKKLAASSILKPFRFYLTITDREGSPLEVSEDAKSRINICVQGDDDFATGIDEVKSENSNVKTAVYDLSGRRVQKAQKGIFIQNGKLMVK